MRRFLCILIGIAVLTAVGCGNKTGSIQPEGDTSFTSETAAPETEDKSESEPETEPESYAPLATVRDRDIINTDEFSYEIYKGYAIITKYNGSSENVEIPAEIGGAPVQEIGFYAFEANYSLRSVVLPDTVRKICEGAFVDCPSLSSINLPDGLAEIERGAFGVCVSLTELTIPASVTRIYEQAFTCCDGLTSLTIMNPDLAYENWGLEELPQLTVYAPENSTAAGWAAEMGKFAPL